MLGALGVVNLKITMFVAASLSLLGLVALVLLALTGKPRAEIAFMAKWTFCAAAVWAATYLFAKLQKRWRSP